MRNLLLMTVLACTLLNANQALSQSNTSTKLIQSDCGRQHVKLNDELTAEQVQGASKYEFHIENVAQGYSEIILKNNRKFSPDELATPIIDNVEYDVKVRSKKNNAFGQYGQSCKVKIEDHPNTKLRLVDCGRNDVISERTLKADMVNGATQYQFLVENIALGFSEVITKGTNDFKFGDLSGELNAGVDYEVSIRTEKGGKWSAWGQKCVVQAFGLKTTKLLPPDCGKTEVTENQLLKFKPVPFATSYEVRISYLVSIPYGESNFPALPYEEITESIDVNQSNFRLSDFTQFSYSKGIELTVNIIPSNGIIIGSSDESCSIFTTSSTPTDFYNNQAGVCALGACNLISNGSFEMHPPTTSQVSFYNVTFDSHNMRCWTSAFGSAEVHPISTGVFVHSGTTSAKCYSGYGSVLDQGAGIMKTLPAGNLFEAGKTYLLNYYTTEVAHPPVQYQYVYLANNLAPSYTASPASTVPNYPASDLVYENAQDSLGQIGNLFWRRHTTFFTPMIDYNQIIFYGQAGMITGGWGMTTFYDDISVVPTMQDLTVCAGDTVTLGPTCSFDLPDSLGNPIYCWSPSNLVSDSTALNPTSVVTNTQVFTLKIIYYPEQLHGLPDTVYIDQTVNISATNTPITASSSICFDSTLTLTIAPDPLSSQVYWYKDSLLLDSGNVLTLDSFALGDTICANYINAYGCFYENCIILSDSLDSLSTNFNFQISMIPNVHTCLDSNATLSTNALEVIPTIDWVLPNGSSVNADQLIIGNTGTYQATYTSLNSCVYYDSFTTPTEFNFGIVTPFSIDFCLGDSIQLVAGTGDAPLDSLVWLNDSSLIGTTDSIIIPNDTGWYYLDMYSEYCGLLQDSIYIQQQNPFDFSILTPEGNMLCDSSVTLTTNVDDDYINFLIWVGDNGTSGSGTSFEVSQAGLYHAVLFTSNGCVFRDSIQVTPCCIPDTNYMLVLSGTYEYQTTKDIIVELNNNPSKNIYIMGGIELKNYDHSQTLEIDGYTIHMDQTAAQIKLDNSALILKNSLVKSGCLTMWTGFEIHNNYWDGATITKSLPFEMDNSEIRDAIRAVYVEADLTIVDENLGTNHFAEPNNGINEIKIHNSRFINNLQNIIIDNVNTCPQGASNVCGIRMADLENNLFTVEGTLTKFPYVGYISENHLEIGYVDENNFDTDITIKNNTFENCVKAIELKNYYDVNPHPFFDIEDGSINIEEGNVFTDFYLGAIDLGTNQSKESQFKIKECEFNFANAVEIPTSQTVGIITENPAINGAIRKNLEVVNCDFNGTYRKPQILSNITNQRGINNESGCQDMTISGNHFKQNFIATNIMVYGYEDNAANPKGSILTIEDNVFEKNGTSVNFKDNGVWTFVNNNNVNSLEAGNMINNMNCNNFISLEDGTHSVGISIEAGNTYMGDIGSCVGSRPSGNGWPWETKPDPTNISTWTSPSTWISVDNNSGVNFLYFPYHNEFVADANAYNGISDPVFISNTPDCTPFDGLTGLTCVDTTIVFAAIVLTNENSPHDVIELGNGYPNPTGGMITIPFEITRDFEFAQIQMLNIIGGEVFLQKDIEKNTGYVQFDLSQYPNGTYIYRIVIDGHIEDNKLIGIVK